MNPAMVGQPCADPPHGFSGHPQSAGFAEGPPKAYNGLDNFAMGAASVPGGHYSHSPCPSGAFPCGHPSGVSAPPGQQNGQVGPPQLRPSTLQGDVPDQLSGPMGGLSLQSKQGPPQLPPHESASSPAYSYPLQPSAFSAVPATAQGPHFYGGGNQLLQQHSVPPHMMTGHTAPQAAHLPPQGLSPGPPQGPTQGLPPPPYQPLPLGPSLGLQQSSPLGQPQGLSRGPPQGPHQGHPSRGPPPGPPQAPLHGLPHGQPRGTSHGPSQGPAPVPPQGHLHGPSQGLPAGPVQSRLQHGPSQGLPPGPVQPNLQHGPSQGLPPGPVQPNLQHHFQQQPQTYTPQSGSQPLGSGPPVGPPTGPNSAEGAPPPGMFQSSAPPYGPPGAHQQGQATRPPSMVQQPPQPARKLDPDQMPSPIQVMEDDRKHRSGDFYANKRGQVPPLVTTRFVVHDEGLCSPRYVRSTIYSVPCTPELLKQTAVPFALAITPLARPAPGEMELPMTDFGEDGPVRCIRCKAYMCPLMQFIDGGRRFQCVFCKGTTEVPPQYFAHLDHLGQRSDKFQRPELCLGSYEVLATKEYCKNSVFPNVPAFLFLLDVSYNSIRDGLVQVFCQNIKSVLQHLPRDHSQEVSQVKVGFITYSSVVHFYNIKASLAQPQMLVVPDVHEMFVPLLDGCLVSVQEASAVIDSLMEQIPTLFAETRETETVLGAAIQAGLDAVKAAECAGKLFVFHTTLPIADAPGKLRNRDDRKLLGTDKEKGLLTPQTPFYNQLGQECVAAGCCVDLFLFHNAYIDIATIGQVAKMTGGQIYKYTYFQAETDGTRFLEDLHRDVSRPIAFDAVMRVRTSTGIRPTEFYGNYYMSNTTDIELAALDSDKCIAVEIKYDDKLTEEEGAYIQVALLYTSCSGQRRLRVHNLALSVCSQMADLYRNCDLDTLINFLSKQGVRHLVESGGGPRHVKESSISRAAQMLATYRKHCASPSSSGQLILPESMKLLPLYLNCMLKCDAISGGPELTTDDRSFAMFSLGCMDVASTVAYFYPRLLPLHEGDSEEMPVALRCSIEKVCDDGVYLLENGVYMFLWIGMAVDPTFLQDVFAQPVAARIDISKTSLLELNTPASKRIRGIIEQVRQERQRYMRLTLVRQGDKLEVVFRQFLVEDRQNDGSPSYVDFLCHLHKEIRDLLS